MEKQIYNLTNPQKSIWYTEQFFQGSCVNNICGTVIISDKVDFEKLSKSINSFLKTNDSFRINLFYDNENIKQKIVDFSPIEIPIKQIKNNDELIELENHMVSIPFKLLNSPLFNFTMFEFPDNTGGFVINAHHLIADACTAGLLASKVIDIYSKLLKNEILDENISSYVTYINSEEEYLSSNKFEKDKEYWNNMFNTVPELGAIPSLRPITKNSASALRKSFILTKEKVEQINKFCSKNKVSIFNFFMATYSIYIGRVSNLDDFVLGTPILNRTTFVEKNTPGMFISTVPFRFTTNNELLCVDFMKKIALDSLGMFRHQKYPYQNILEHIRKTNPSQPNLYDILISYQNTRTNKNSAEVPYEVRWTFNNNVADSMQIHLFDMNDEGLLNISYDYRLDKYDEQDIIDIHNRIIYIVEQILQKEDLLVKDIDIVTPNEKNKLLNDFNNTTVIYNKNKTIIEYFEEQVEKTPNNIALVFENKTLTYKELNEKVNSFANYLRNNGITRNSIIGVMVSRSFEMIISILAVLKSGGAYIPIDPEYPTERISYMLSCSNSPVLICLEHLKDRISEIKFNGKVIFANLDNSQIYNSENKNLNIISKPDDLSYIIYTSGSTGNPKGVMLTHKNLSNFINSMSHKISYLNDKQYHSIVSITTVSFDIFAFETLISLCNGLKLFITNEAEQKITLKLERLLIDNKIEIIQSTPSIMNFHIENSSINGFSGLKYVMLAGEQLPKQLVNKIKEITTNCTVYNGYGPSETTIFSTVKNVTSLDIINIGEPIDNTQIYILDKNLCLLPEKNIGEIYISGDGVGKGYIGREDLTSERYLKNPYISNSIMYKTGDLGIWLPNGSIECKGRSDNQVKLHGLRIELGEIEECINSFNAFYDIKSAVILKDENGKVSLNSFISSKKDISLSDLKDYISSKLPAYMIPNTYTFLDSLPFTPNGKIDRKALKNYKVDNQIVDLSYTPPRNDTEKIILNSIKRKLNLNEFGIDNNIFDFGADSLIIINLLTDLFQYNLSLKVYDFYQYPTIRELYDHLLSNNEVQKPLNGEELSKLNKIVEGFSSSSNSNANFSYKNIFLTGVTGFLGCHILSELLDNSNKIEKIYCSIRQKDNKSIKDRFMEKIHFYFGTKYDLLIDKYVVLIDSNIDYSLLGLSELYLKDLKNNLDCVIHCAANVKHYGNYDDFAKTNINGTKNIVEFCKYMNIPLHYISTMTISGNYLLEQNNTDIIFNENNFYFKQSFDDNVYAKSKLIAESIILNAIKNGFDATIYRVGDLVGRYSDGIFQKNIVESSIYMRLKSIFEIGIVPSSILNNLLEFTPVEYASKAICKILWSDSNKNRIFHIYNPNMITISKLIEYMKVLNYNIKISSYEEFMKIINDLSKDSNTQSILSGIINDFTEDNDFIYNHIIKTDNSLTCKYLNNLNFDWPKLDLQYIEKMFKYMINIGFLNV